MAGIDPATGQFSLDYNPALAGVSGQSPNINAGSDFESLGLGGGGEKSFGSKLSPYIQGFSALANAYLGYQSLELGKDQFKFQKDSFNTNLANQAKLTNAQQEAQQYARLAGRGTYDRTTEAGRTALATDLAKYTDANQVSGAPV